MPSADPIVICGGGIIGTALSYYLAKRGQSSIVLDKDGVAAAASGRAGGFLALDWNDSSPVGPLSRLSYALHATLEEELGADLGYRCVDTFAVAATDEGSNAIGDLLRAGRGHKALGSWVDGHVTKASRLGDATTTAQVNPKKLTEAFMAKAAQLAGSTFQKGAVHEIIVLPAEEGVTESRVTGVRVDKDVVIPASAVVVAMGPWSQLASAWLPLPMAVSGQKYHSLVVKPACDIPAVALFTSIKRKTGLVEPEIYPRPGGEVYVCGEPETPPLPPSAAQVLVNDEKCDRVLRNVSVVASCLADAEVVARQACFLPITPDGVPVIGKIPGVSGAYIASGHSCWGILNAPATGLAMSELLLDGRSVSLDLRAFSPDRFL